MNLTNFDAAKVIAQHQIRPQLDCESYSGLNSNSSVFQPTNETVGESKEVILEKENKKSKKVRKGR